MVTTFNLHGIMEQELKRDFPGIYGTLESETGPERADELDRIYQQLTKVRSTIERIDRQIRDARDLIAQKATLRDVGTIREQASERFRNFKSDMHGFRTNCDDAVDLLDKIKELDKGVIDWFDELKLNLSGSSDKDALLWIGLGQGRWTNPQRMPDVLFAKSRRCQVFSLAHSLRNYIGGQEENSARHEGYSLDKSGEERRSRIRTPRDF